MQATLSSADRTPLAGYFLQSVLGRVPDSKRAGMLGRYRIQVSRMVVTVAVSADRAEILPGAQGPFDATLSAELPAFVEMAAGAGPVGLFFDGRLRVGGKFWRFLPLLKALKAPPPAEACP